MWRERRTIGLMMRYSRAVWRSAKQYLVPYGKANLDETSKKYLTSTS
jgi:hypothetical protein